MKRFIAILILAVLIGFATHVASAQTASVCPEGSYQIDVTKDGQPLCKLQPTGCPYGDSIPLGPDCDKHAPQPTQPTQTVADSSKGEPAPAEVEEYVAPPEGEYFGK